MLVARLMPAARARLATIGDDAPLIEAAKLLRAGTDLVVVCGPEGLLAGVITKTDVVDQISHCLGASCTTAASLVMTRDVVPCQPGDRLNEVWAKMKEHGLKNVPVTDRDCRPVGVLNARDALQLLLKEVENEAPISELFKWLASLSGKATQNAIECDCTPLPSFRKSPNA